MHTTWLKPDQTYQLLDRTEALPKICTQITFNEQSGTPKSPLKHSKYLLENLKSSKAI